ncbi:MAG: MiAMP1 family antimicrobial peptide [Streptomyces sp.]|uniref:MiAMP1 family antimicrobial peptide n=1 Tax=Streptomyces sp. B93 TaxID=2824875 RepID=UPI0019A87D77|nr:MiAMP1 family antimicrobial peptide [Streptomyces sp. B93]MBC7267253.1 MiAMP1 family antimicrobial peptide [Streptomyces sp.]MBQ1091481.1 MiAMP1 family antimicrobial peptide [Streptomyces sp. B93]
MRKRRSLRTAVGSLMLSGALVLGTGTSFASSFLSWEGPQNTGRAKEVHACGCNNIDPNYRAAYRFTYTGQTAAMYNEPDCRGLVHHTFRGSQESKDAFGWRSVFFHC